MPPTTGHLQLVQFASLLAPNGVVVIVCTQLHEPMVEERVEALKAAITNRGLRNVTLVHFNKTIEQDPKTAGFWDSWRQLMLDFGVTKDDYIVAS